MNHRQLSPWEIGLSYWEQRDLYTRNASVDWDGYARGPSSHPRGGSYAYRRPKSHAPRLNPSSTSLYEREAWPWLNYKLDEEPPAPPTDAELTRRVDAAYATHPELDASDISIHSHHGIVTLDGTVSDAHQRRLAGEIAGTVEGVVQVRNQLAVRPDDPTDATVAFVLPVGTVA